MLRAVSAFVLIVAMAGCGTPAPQAGGNVQYVASSAREPFHLPSCQWAAKISGSNRQTFATREAAIQAGHRACKVCRP